MVIDILNREISIDGKLLRFPASYDEVKSILGEARIEEGKHKEYIYDKEGIKFEEGDKEFLRYRKAYIDDLHLIKSVVVYATNDHDIPYDDFIPQNLFVGCVIFNGRKVENDYFNNYKGFYQDFVHDENGECYMAPVGAYIYGKDENPNFDCDRLLKNVLINFSPQRPKCKENYNIEQPKEPCLVFDNFNFKLAIIQELMYEQDVLKPCFDIYDYMEFKKANWNLDTEKNVRGAVNFFKELPIPVSLAEKVETINMDGGDDVYMNIAPLWDGEDERFDIDKLSAAELKQFPNLKSMNVLSSKIDSLKKVCDPLGIDVSL